LHKSTLPKIVAAGAVARRCKLVIPIPGRGGHGHFSGWARDIRVLGRTPVTMEIAGPARCQEGMTPRKCST
jgi:hypothetical protein